MSVQVSTRISPETKQQFDSVCERIGVSPSNALNIFIMGVINHRGIPFMVAEPQEESPTVQALNKARKAFSGFAEECGLKDDQDVVNLIKEMRRERRTNNNESNA